MGKEGELDASFWSYAIARSIHQSPGLRFPCNDLTLGLKKKVYNNNHHHHHSYKNDNNNNNHVITILLLLLTK